MNYTITGASGNISKPLVESLLKAGHKVTVIGRSLKNLKSLIDQGANAAVGSISDISFVTEAFKGSDAVYLMAPNDFSTSDMKGHAEKVVIDYAKAVEQSGVKYVVNLSSIGAHLADGAGPINGLHRGEEILNKLDGINILHLRPAFFYINFFNNVGMVRDMNIIGNNFEVNEKRLPLVSPTDIAAQAFEALTKLNFSGKAVQYVVSDLVSTSDVAREIGKAVGKPELPWVVFTNDQAKQGLIGAGFSEHIADNYVEMGAGMNNGSIVEDFFANNSPINGKVKLSDFAKEFAAVYHKN